MVNKSVYKKDSLSLSFLDANIRIVSWGELRYCLKEVRNLLNLIKHVVRYCYYIVCF